MSLNWSFWIVAWCLMALTFVTATGAILLGTRGLDRSNPCPDEDQHGMI